MTDKRNDLDDSGVRRVLQAEADARERIAKAERDAAETVEHARAEARRIESDAVKQAQTFQAACTEEAEHHVHALGEAGDKRLAAIEQEQLDPQIRDAAAGLARELIRFEGREGNDES